MALKTAIQRVGRDTGFPLDRSQLVAALETEGEGEGDALLVVHGMQIDRIKNDDALDLALDEALGVPDADTTSSVLDQADPPPG